MVFVFAYTVLSVYTDRICEVGQTYSLARYINMRDIYVSLIHHTIMLYRSWKVGNVRSTHSYLPGGRAEALLHILNVLFYGGEGDALNSPDSC